ncbi:hypothetical protein SK128_017615 [Halocaridina rubra]|uniref:TIR domain-containing protein n=1 Tax=Halocaridina rubra TaxID=373956 RepID=A0AAN8XC28_HALRR
MVIPTAGMNLVFVKMVFLVLGMILLPVPSLSAENLPPETEFRKSAAITEIGHEPVVTNGSNNSSNCTGCIQGTSVNTFKCLGESPYPANYSFKCPNYRALTASLRCFISKCGNIGNITIELEDVNGVLNLGTLPTVKIVSLRIKNANLTDIVISESRISEISESLQELDLQGNPKFNASTILSFGRLRSLTHLYLRNTTLNALEYNLSDLLKRIPKLTHLDLSATGMNTLQADFTGNMDLKYLDISRNKLGTITLTEKVINQLSYLNVSGNGVSTIEIVQSSHLKSITPRAEHQNMTRNLRVLDVSNNKLTYIPQLLIEALVQENPVLKLGNNSWSAGCGKCSFYYMWKFLRNKRSSWERNERSSWGKLFNCFRENEVLQKCDWDMCPRGCHCDQNSKVVNCTATGLKKLPEVGPSQVETLIVKRNHLTSLLGIESPIWCNLKTLDADENNITSLLPLGVSGKCRCYEEGNYYSEDMSCFPQNLENLYLNKNNLKSFHTSDCSILYPLKRLEVSRNQVTQPNVEDCSYFEQLEVLDLSHNKIRYVDESKFASFPLLKRLLLSHNDIRQVHLEDVIVMRQLKLLDLSYNDLNYVDDKLSVPRTIFYTNNTPRLENLFLNNNSLSYLSYALSLSEFPNLKNLTLHNNPWFCCCPDLDTFMESLSNSKFSALKQARQDMRCGAASKYTMGRKFDDFTNEVCLEERSRNNVLLTGNNMLLTVLGTILLAVIIIYFIVKLVYSNIFKAMNRTVAQSRQEASNRRKYDCFVVSSSADQEKLYENVIEPLTQRGYRIAWHHNAFRPGYWIHENIERAVRNSSRMLVYATKNANASKWVRREITRGRHEEFVHHDFKIVALVDETLPLHLYPEIFELVQLRTHILLSDRDYIQQICHFLPPPASPEHRLDGNSHTNTEFKESIERIMNAILTRGRTESIPLGEIFHTSIDHNHIIVNVDVATASCTAALGRQALSNLSKEEKTAIIERYKNNVQIADLDTSSLQYELKKEDNDDTSDDIFKEKNFVRCTYATISCRF